MAAPKPLPQLQPDRYAVGLFDCCAAPGGCGRCASSERPSLAPRAPCERARARRRLCDRATPATGVANQRGGCCIRATARSALVWRGAREALGLSAPSQALTSPSAGPAPSASSPASSRRRAPGACDAQNRSGLLSTALQLRPTSATSDAPPATRSFAGNCCAAGWAYCGLQVASGFVGGASAPPASLRAPAGVMTSLCIPLLSRARGRASHLAAAALPVPPEHPAHVRHDHAVRL